MADHHVPPVYPLVGDIWQSGHTPAGGPADIVDVPCQLYVSTWGPQQVWTQSGTPAPTSAPTLIKLAPGIAVFGRGDIIQPDNTVAEYYLVKYREIYYKGFVSSFEGLIVWQCNANGTTPRTY